MKKIFLVLIFVLVLGGTGTVFANASHPGGLGIGVMWRGNMAWEGGDFNAGGAALSLKLPGNPYFWAINLQFGDFFGIGVSGDRYLAGGQLVDPVYWYLGLGGYLSFASSDAGAILGLGLRAPIGLSLQFIQRSFEFFVEVAPSLGVSFWTYGDGGANFPDGSFNVGIGFRVWP